MFEISVNWSQLLFYSDSVLKSKHYNLRKSVFQMHSLQSENFSNSRLPVHQPLVKYISFHYLNMFERKLVEIFKDRYDVQICDLEKYLRKHLDRPTS